MARAPRLLLMCCRVVCCTPCRTQNEAARTPQTHALRLFPHFRLVHPVYLAMSMPHLTPTRLWPGTNWIRDVATGLCTSVVHRHLPLNEVVCDNGTHKLRLRPLWLRDVKMLGVHTFHDEHVCVVRPHIDVNTLGMWRALRPRRCVAVQDVRLGGLTQVCTLQLRVGTEVVASWRSDDVCPVSGIPLRTPSTAVTIWIPREALPTPPAISVQFTALTVPNDAALSSFRKVCKVFGGPPDGSWRFVVHDGVCFVEDNDRLVYGVTHEITFGCKDERAAVDVTAGDGAAFTALNRLKRHYDEFRGVSARRLAVFTAWKAAETFDEVCM